MDTAPSGRTFASDDAVADNSQGAGGGVSAGNLGGLESSGSFGQLGQRGRHWSYSSEVSVSSFSASGRKRPVNDSKPGRLKFYRVSDLSLGSPSGFAGRGRFGGC